MAYCMNRKIGQSMGKAGKSSETIVKKDFFLGKFKENLIFTLNSGNFCVTLQPELCPARF